jgi:hypothetical protein
MSGADRKVIDERSIFERFCAAASLEVTPGSVVQPEPPAPDLQAEIVGAGTVAFELVRLNDDDHLMRFSFMQQTLLLLHKEFAALDAATHAALSAKYADGLIAVHSGAQLHWRFARGRWRLFGGRC